MQFKLFQLIPDIQPHDFPAIDWANASAEALGKLRAYVVTEIKLSAAWYIRKRSLKRRIGQAIRLGAMILAAIAGVLPVLATILVTDGKPNFNAAWATVLLAWAAFFVGLDYFFGFTSGWVRYLIAQQNIARLVYEFEFDWETLRAAWAAGQPTPEQIQAALIRLKKALLDTQQVVEVETAEWATEFKAAILKLDAASRAKAETSAGPCAVNVTLAGGSVAQWTVSVDGGASQSASGTRKALLVSAGTHTFVAEGSVGGQPARDEAAVVVNGPGVTEVALTLR
ncbi:SLATT domain-containing protein [Limnoglobus roseus]|uniref:SMODS and SLOG-associating 2TM effector domain-containing protein n=1 Tax=Limnoglobus roseus TaxID=2598579 RepID=A0A5C1A9F3_9BACT|nr:DUF4231 domain-containing protein [Limnoglobus roseus]QEL14857.1 hypothetical protein PX52LOC_01756 [Limnoglobus roseus]